MDRPKGTMMWVDLEGADVKRVDQAVQYLQEGNFASAESILRDVCSRCPERYQYENTIGNARYIRSWDMVEFANFLDAHANNTIELSVWIGSAYPRACYYIGFILVARGDFAEAIRWLTKGHSMEPQNPIFFCELGVAYGSLNDHQTSLDCYKKALDISSASNQVRAAALRGIGVQMIDLQRYEEAELQLRESQKLEPDSHVARQELAYVTQLRKGRQEGQGRSSWWKLW
jgi:tetratricopeptide (TPR) repeat protein